VLNLNNRILARLRTRYNSEKEKNKMRRSVYLGISLIVLAAFVSFPVFGAGQTFKREHPLKNIRARSETGEKVAQRIKQLRRTSTGLQAALAAFERNGATPKIDEAVSIVGRREKAREVINAHHARQQVTLSGEGAEVTFITALQLYNEWQGTVITRFFDENGVFEDQYVSNLVITRSEYVPSEWTVRHDVEYGANGVGLLFHRPGMFTKFQLGISVQQQAAPLSLDPAQFTSTAAMDLYYDRFPEQTSYDFLPTEPEDGGRTMILNAHAKAKAPQAGGSPAQRFVMGPWLVPTLTGWRGAARESGLRCGAAAGGCALGSIIFAEMTFGPCFVSGCGGAVIFGVLNNVRPTLRNVR
jgi:hypothetical protein